MPSDLPRAVLFACTLNAVRSPMAAGLMRHFFGHMLDATSVGVRHAEDVNGFALASMAELGIDISSHQPRTFADLGLDAYDLVITLTPEAHHQALEIAGDGGIVEYWPTFDPTLSQGNREQILTAFRDVRNALWGNIKNRFGAPRAPTV